MRSLEGLSVLVVEDEGLIAMEIASALERLGCRVVGPCRTVERAERVVAAGRPEAALLDVNLGGRPGYRLARTLVRQGVPVVLVTGYDGAQLPADLRGLPRLDKPFRDDDLARTLARTVQA